MCVHLTKSGDICKRSPDKFLCSVHALKPEFTLVRGNISTSQGPADLIDINGHSALFMGSGEIMFVNPDVPFETAPSAPTPAPSARKPFGKVRCGKCHEIHDSVNAVKVCYLQARRESE